MIASPATVAGAVAVKAAAAAPSAASVQPTRGAIETLPAASSQMRILQTANSKQRDEPTVDSTLL
jgi:hypothetical protein